MPSLLAQEMYWIAHYGTYRNGTIGYNLTLGGEGNAGYRHTDVTKEKLSLAGKGRLLSQEHKDKLSAANTGKTLSQEHKDKIAAGNKGKVRTEAMNAVNSERGKQLTGEKNPFFGKTHSEENKVKFAENARALHTGTTHNISPEGRQRMSDATRAAHLGSHHSQETKEKMAAAHLARHGVKTLTFSKKKAPYDSHYC